VRLSGGGKLPKRARPRNRNRCRFPFAETGEATNDRRQPGQASTASCYCLAGYLRANRTISLPFEKFSPTEVSMGRINRPSNSFRCLQDLKLILPEGQHHEKYSAARFVRLRPQPTAVCFDNRSADRQAHAQTGGLGCIECVKDALGIG
jgi:hypothetical protein